MAQRKALGRGLSALLGTPTPETAIDSEKLREIDIDRIRSQHATAPQELQ